jgi:hypothetical protein
MSTESLTKFLNKLHGELKKSSAVYRAVDANKRPHLFRFTSTKFATQLKRQIESQGIPLSNADRKFINDEADTLLNNLKSKLMGIKATDKKIKTGKTYVRMTFTSSTEVAPGQYADPESIYHKIYNSYRPLLKTSFERIQNYLRQQEFTHPGTGRKRSKIIRTTSGKTERKAAGRELNLGHVEGKSVVESFIRDAFEEVLSSEGVYTDNGDALSEADIRQDMSDLGIDVRLIKNTKIDSYTVELESAKGNRADGQILKANKKKLERQIKAAVKKLGGIENLKGSDSIKEKYIKKTRQEVLEPFKKIGATVSAKSTKIKEKSSNRVKSSSAKAVKASNSRKRAGRKALPALLKARKSREQSSSAQPLQLIGLLNKQLPGTVRKNMQEPALVNRTGRFASSVQVTDVVQTPKGYPSFGYTYQRNPYQVFEEGSSGNWANGNRDPRDLIDKSIREVAAQFAIGRFYTRRQ